MGSVQKSSRFNFSRMHRKVSVQFGLSDCRLLVVVLLSLSCQFTIQHLSFSKQICKLSFFFFNLSNDPTLGRYKLLSQYQTADIIRSAVLSRKFSHLSEHRSASLPDMSVIISIFSEDEPHTLLILGIIRDLVEAHVGVC